MKINKIFRTFWLKYPIHQFLIFWSILKDLKHHVRKLKLESPLCSILLYKQFGLFFATKAYLRPNFFLSFQKCETD